MRMEPAKFFVAGCACVLGAFVAIEYAHAQQFVYPVPPPPPPIFNPSSPYTVPQTRETPVSPNAPSALLQLRGPRARVHADGDATSVRVAFRCRQRAGRESGLLQQDTLGRGIAG